MPILIGIRHGCDLHPEDRGESSKRYAHDFSLCEDKQHTREIQHKVRSLVQRYDVPSIIYVSPLKRCRQTAQLFTDEIYRRYKTEVAVKVHLDISRYFPDSPRIRPSTEAWNPPLDANLRAFERRHRRFLNSLKDDDEDEEDVVWCVTHALNLNVLIGDRDPSIDFLESFRIL